jgi:heme oxygenase
LNIDVLRRETASDHEAVEGSIPLMAEDLDTDRYVAVLKQLYGIVVAWEELLADISPDWLQEIRIPRRRQGMLRDDLAYFGIEAAPQPTPTLPPIRSLTELLGAMYVMEGSTLGGQLIARHVERVLHLEPGIGDAYFRSHGDKTGTMWKEFCEVLRRRIPDAEARDAVFSAKKMFQAFGTWMRGCRP